MSNNFYKEIRDTEIKRYPKEGKGAVKCDSAVRVYKSSPGSVTLQVRGPEMLRTFKPSKFGIIATARLNLDELTAIRDAINISLSELTPKKPEREDLGMRKLHCGFSGNSI